MTIPSDCQALRDKHKAKFLLEIYQSEAGRLKGGSFDEFTRAGNGVCAAMAAEWIRLNLLDERSGEQMDIFRTLVGSNWQLHLHFVAKQHERSEQIERIKTLSAEADLLIAKARSVSDIHKDPSALRKVFYAKSIPSVSAVNTHIREANAATQRFEKAKQDYLDGISGFLSKAERLQEGKPISNLVVNLKTLLSKKGYYFLEITPQGESEGHAMAFQTVGLPRLLDANTCEWEFMTFASLCSFWTEYFLKFYQTEYAGGTFALTFFPDTFFEKMQFSDPWYWKTPLPSIDDLEDL